MIIVGGGIVGTSAAAFLADAGIRVTLVEREGLASGASGANQGIVQHPFDPVLDPLYHDTLALLRDLSAPGSGFHLSDEPAGMLFLSPDEAVVRGEAAEINATFDHVGTDVVGGSDLRRLEPALGEGLWACRADIGYAVAPGASTYAYATRAEALGAVIRQGRAASLTVRGGAMGTARPSDSSSSEVQGPAATRTASAGIRRPPTSTPTTAPPRTARLAPRPWRMTAPSPSARVAYAYVEAPGATG